MSNNNKIKGIVDSAYNRDTTYVKKTSRMTLKLKNIKYIE